MVRNQVVDVRSMQYPKKKILQFSVPPCLCERAVGFCFFGSGHRPGCANLRKKGLYLFCRNLRINYSLLVLHCISSDTITPLSECSICRGRDYDFSEGSLSSGLMVEFWEEVFDFSFCPTGFLLSSPILRSGICKLNVNWRRSFPVRLSCCLRDESLPIRIDRSSLRSKKI